MPRRGKQTGVAGRACRRLLPWVLAAAAALLAGAPAALGAAEDALSPGLNVALQDDYLPVVPEGAIQGRLGLLDSTGVGVTRVDVLWDQVAPSRPAAPADPRDPAYRWSRYDQIVDGLTARGIAVIFNVYRAPRWSNGGRGPAWVPPAQTFGDFMAALARRYDGVTPDQAGRVHGPVEIYQPWNEPNLAGFLQPQYRGSTSLAAGLYAGLLRAAYGAVKAAQPGAWVIAAGLGPSGTDRPPGSTSVKTFARELAPLRPPADAFAQHLYTAIGPADSWSYPSYRRLDEVIAELDLVWPGAPMLITEFGWSTSPSPARGDSYVSEALQAAYLRQAIDMLKANPRVRLAVWFNLQDHPEWTSGLRRADLSPKPAWDVFRSVAGPRRPRPRAGAPAPPGPRRDVVRRPPRTVAGRLLAEQRMAQAAVRRLAAVQRWLDAGLVAGDLRDGGLGRGQFSPTVGLAGEGAPIADGLATPRPLPVLPTRRVGPRGRVRASPAQLLVNRRISRAALRHATALRRRLGGLTGGDLREGAVTASKLAPGLSVASVALPGPDTPRSRTRVAPPPRRPQAGIRITVAQLRINRRLAITADRRAKGLARVVARGLTGAHFRSSTIGATDIAEDLRE